jgi:hypothetical protein
MNVQSVLVRLVDQLYINTDSAAGFVASTHSHEIAPLQENVVVGVTVLNMDTDLILAVRLEGSHDGRTWRRGGLAAADLTFDTTVDTGVPDPPPAYKSSNSLKVDYAFLRLKVDIEQVLEDSGGALLSANLVFTHQT